MTSHRVHNFCAGPCTLPINVIDELANELANFNDSGMSLIEMSHRSEAYDQVHNETIDLLRRLCKVPDEFSILLLQGGASLQFAMLPMNLLQPNESAGYIVSGTWGKKAFGDAKLIGNAYEAWSGANNDFASMPDPTELTIQSGTRYLHITSNETIGGIRLPAFFSTDVRQVADMSSDYLTRDIPWDQFDVVYGGAQKNLGPAGLTVVFVRKTVADAAPNTVPAYLRYATHAVANSLANTPPVFSIWATGKVLRWIEENGGVAGMENRAATRSQMLYDAIDNSNGFYQSPVNPDHRSHVNIVFRLGSEELEKDFLAEATQHDLMNLKGHRSVGGIRASIYNALPTESVESLLEFMSTFANGRG